nr:MAG TPA: hypothetical protein [Caudoviricetes sp.]
MRGEIMTESFNLLRRVQSLDISPELPGYSRVTIYAGQNEKGENKIYTAGDDTGTTLEITNEWGTQEMATAILEKIQGWRYQPYKASGSSIDPSSEIGDAVTISDIYGGIFAKKTTYGKYIRTDLEAPSKEEVEHEFQVQSPTDRQYARFTSDVRSKLTIQAEAIEARVEKVHGKTTENFWWSLQSDGWSVGNQSGAIFKVNSSGAEVEGEIRATSGNIGGLTIEKNRLSSGNLDFGGEVNDGVYLGPKGIQCGSASAGVQLTSDGNLYAENGYFRGTVQAGNIEYGKQTDDDGTQYDAGTFNGDGVSLGTITGDRMVANTISTAYTSNGINTSLDYADKFNDACTNEYTAVDKFYTGKLYAGTLIVNGYRYGLVTIEGGDGNYYNVLATSG